MQKMYYRLKNKLDVDLFVSSVLTDEKYHLVVERLNELVEILDSNYGAERGVNDMGGYILYFPDKSCYDAMISKLENFYHIDSSCYEYRDELSDDTNKETVAFCEDLYLISSDDALVFVYPKEVIANV